MSVPSKDSSSKPSSHPMVKIEESEPKLPPVKSEKRKGATTKAPTSRSTGTSKGKMTVKRESVKADISLSESEEGATPDNVCLLFVSFT